MDHPKRTLPSKATVSVVLFSDLTDKRQDLQVLSSLQNAEETTRTAATHDGFLL